MPLVLALIGIASGILGAGVAYGLGFALWMVLAAFIFWGNVGSGTAIVIALLIASNDAPTASPQLSPSRSAQQAR